MFKCFGLIRVLARGQALALLLFANAASAEDKEPFAMLELGAAAEWGLNGGGSSFGPSAAVEFPVIKNWLEIETGVQTLFSPNFSHKPAKHLILLEPRSKCSHKLFQIPIDTTQMQ